MRPLDTSIDQILPFATDAALRRRFMVAREPIRANLRWGHLLEVLDSLAEDVALRYVRLSAPNARVVTAAIDEIVLHVPADVTQDLHLHARINYVGRTSLEVGIRVDQGGAASRSLASCYFTMVARAGVGDTVRNIPVAPLEYADDMERFRRDMAVERRETYQRQLAAARAQPSGEEHMLLAGLHAAQDRPGFSGLLAGRLQRSNWERMYPEQENVPEKIFGGYLIRRAFDLAHLHMEEIAPDRPVVARVDRINFLQPVRIGDKLQFTSRIVYSGETSLGSEISIERVSADRVTRALSNTCAFTFVNVDAAMRPRPVPQVHPTTYAEDARYLEAHRRRMRHKQSAHRLPREEERSGAVRIA
jgi:acyl-coenzyme A thioesterase 9